MPISPGSVVADRYRVIKPIGEGGFGVVYKVEHILLGKLFALKVLHQDMDDEQVAVTRFKREAVTTSRIAHPNIVAVTDFGTIGHRIYYVMELLQGMTLEQKLADKKTYSISQALPVLAPICDALRAAHDVGVVHRDLKPANVFLVPTKDLQRGTKKEVVKVLDFGLAKLASQGTGTSTKLTQHGHTVGTVGFVAPEQVMAEEVDHRADIYSFGCIAFQMFAGKPVFSGTVTEVALAHCERQAPTIREANAFARVPREMEQLVARCLEKQPAKRPASFREVLSELQRMARSLLTPDGNTWEGAYDSMVELSSLAETGVVDPETRLWAPGASPGPSLHPSEEATTVRPPQGMEDEEPVDDGLGATMPMSTLQAVATGEVGAGDIGSTLPMKRQRVLICEADENLASQLTAAVRATGFVGEVVPPGEVIQHVAQDPPVLVILGGVQPGRSGYALCDELKTRPDLRGVPVILTSAATADATFHSHRNRPTRANGYLASPFSEQALLAKINEVLGGLDTPLPSPAGRPAELFAVNDNTEMVAPLPADYLREPTGPRRRGALKPLLIGLVALNLVVLAVAMVMILTRQGGQSTAALLLKIDPAGATIQVDGQDLQGSGRTRIVNGIQNPRVQVRAQSPGCVPQTRTVTVTPGGVTTLELSLTCSGPAASPARP